MKKYIFNPKTQGSGIITCIPQEGLCPNKCKDCFFQAGRSYLEPLTENLPQIPDAEIARGRIIRINDGNDSSNQRELVETIAQHFDDYFFNTSLPIKLKQFSGPVVLTINPHELTDRYFYKLHKTPNNLMFVRFRTNMWNLQLLDEAIKYYTEKEVPIVITFMAYYTETIPEEHKQHYEWKKRTLNSYWVLTSTVVKSILDIYQDNPYVYSCGTKGQYACKFCGNCLREYYRIKERTRI